jgi:hypothetical protein
MLEPAALQIRLELLFDVLWQRLAVGRAPIEQRRLGPVATVARRVAFCPVGP